MATFITAQEAAELIQDNAVLGVCGFGLAGYAAEVAEGIKLRYAATKHPKNIILRQTGTLGDSRDRGPVQFSQEGLVDTWITSIIGFQYAMAKLVADNKMKCYCFPQGVLVNLFRESARGGPGFITKVGLGTFVDPRIEGGKCNEITTEDLVELIEIDGEEWLRYKNTNLDVALVRGTTADEWGNISFEKEGIINEGFHACATAKRNGGITIIQVERIVKGGSLRPRDVKIPGVLVDYVVVSTDEKWSAQSERKPYNPFFAENLKKPVSQMPRLPLNARKVIARRAAMEIQKGNTVNLGIGIPAGVGLVVAEEGHCDDVVFAVEAGPIGGVAAPYPDFGFAYNAWSILDEGYMFDFIDGGNLDITCLGLAEVDQTGNLNVTKFPSRINGPGGFPNVTCLTPKIIFCGQFMDKSKLEVGNGKLTIIEEGSGKKFVKNVLQITFSGKEAVRCGLEVLYVTERAVFKLIDGRVVLVEYAPGIDLEKDVLAYMGFKPEISPDLKLMDAELFSETWGRLGETLK